MYPTCINKKNANFVILFEELINSMSLLNVPLFVFDYGKIIYQIKSPIDLMYVVWSHLVYLVN